MGRQLLVPIGWWSGASPITQEGGGGWVDGHTEDSHQDEKF